MDKDDRTLCSSPCFDEARVIAHACVHYVRGNAAFGVGGDQPMETSRTGKGAGERIRGEYGLRSNPQEM